MWAKGCLGGFLPFAFLSAARSMCRTLRSVQLRRVAVGGGSVRASVGARTRRKSNDGESLFDRIDSRKLQRLDETLTEANSQRALTFAEVIPRMRTLVSRLEAALCSPRARLVVVGSLSSSLFYRSDSDVDLCFFPVLPANERAEFFNDFLRDISFREYFLWTVHDLLVKRLEADGEPVDAKRCEVIPHSSTPLVTLRLRDGLGVDIQFANEGFQTIRNTNLMRMYHIADPRFSAVYLWARALFEALGIKRSKEGLFSSYHILCLVVHFLQCEEALNVPVLPVLCRSHVHLASPEIAIEKVVDMLNKPVDSCDLQGWKSANEMSVSEIVIRFVEYYRKNFNTDQWAIWIAEGITKNKAAASMRSSLTIFDPYSDRNICYRPHSAPIFRRAIGFTYQKMLNGEMVDSFPQFPEAKYFSRNLQWKPHWHFRKVIRPFPIGEDSRLCQVDGTTRGDAGGESPMGNANTSTN